MSLGAKRSYCTLIWLVVIALALNSSSLFALTAAEKNRVDARSWTPSRAATVQAKAAIQQLEELQLSTDNQKQLKYRNEILRQRSGYRAKPHTPTDREDQQLKEQTHLLLERQRNDISVAIKGGIPVADALESIVPSQAAAVVTMVLKTPARGPLSSGGWAIAYQPGLQGYLGQAYINADGSVNLPISVGEEIDLVVRPNPPFAMQLVAKITVLEGGDVLLKDGVEIDVNLTDLDGKSLSGVSANMALALKFPRVSFSGDGGDLTGNGSIFLAPGEVYELQARPQIPYLSSAILNVDSLSSPLVFALEKGITLTVEFEDPDQLLGKNACRSVGSVSIYSSQDQIGGRFKKISEPVLRYDAISNLIGFKTAVPLSVAVDYEVRFRTGSNNCALEDISSKLAWFSNDHTVPVTLKPRPIPNIIFQTPDGDPLVWEYGIFWPESLYESAQFITPTQAPAFLTSGRSYWVTLRTTGNYSINSAHVVVQAGIFDVLLESKPLVEIKGNITVAGAFNVAALLEFYKDSALVQAFEFRGREMTMDVPADTYDIRVSGVTGIYSDIANNKSYSIFLEPFLVERTFTGTDIERLDFDLLLPTTGIDFELPNTPLPYHFSAYKDGKQVAGQIIPFYIKGILSDFDSLELIVRGPGFNDKHIVVSPGTGFPVLDIASLQEPVGRLTGTVVDHSLSPLEGISIDVYGQDGVFGTFIQTTDLTGTFDIPKSKNSLIIFNAPDGGGTLMVFRPVLNAHASDNVQIVMPALEFHSVSEGGAVRQLLYGTGSRSYKIVFLSEGYVAQKESFTDSNLNEVWDGALFIDLNGNGLWETNEPSKTYGERIIQHNDAGTDISLDNEAFDDVNADGYPNIDDFAVFVQNSRDYIRSLLGTPAINNNITFDAYIIYLPSPQAGIDVFDASETKIIDYDTRFDGALHLGRGTLSADTPKVWAALGIHAPDRALTVVMINQPVRAGRVNSFILASGGVGNTSPNDFISGHEFGHNPGGLADEYDEFNNTNKLFVTPTVKHLSDNIVTEDLPWAKYLDSRTDLPVSAPGTHGNGVYAGGWYSAGGVFRSTSNSRMRHNAPLYNDISMEVLRESLCRKSLQEDDFRGEAATVVKAGTLFGDSFEARNGVLVLCK